MQENNPIPTPEVSTPVIVEQPKQSNFLVILLSVLLVISISIAAFFAYQTQKLVRELQEIKDVEEIVNTTEPTAEPIATESSELDPTADWKTYTYQKISFKYPSNWTLVTDKMIAVQPPYINAGDEFPAISFYAIDNPNNLTVKEYDDMVSSEGMDPALYSYFAGSGEVIATEKIINDMKGYYLKDQNCEPLGCDKFSFVYGKKIYVITNIFDSPSIPDVTPNSQKAEMRKVYDQILPTFKFLE